MTEQALIDAARAGDAAAFEALVRPRRGELRAHCYRMLGSASDADDALQDALLSAWRGIGRFEGRSSMRAWLYRIATNASLKTIERRPPRVLPLDLGPPGDPHDGVEQRLDEVPWLEPLMIDDAFGRHDGPAGPEARYELRESVELAFVAALQHLPARQRAVLVLRDVLGFAAAEVAGLLDTSVASVNSALQRAHATVDDRLPQRSQQATLAALGDAGLRELVDAYVDAWERADVPALTSLLTDDVRLTMPPIPTWFAGRENVIAFLSRGPLRRERERRIVPLSANGQIAFAEYVLRDDAKGLAPHSLLVVTVRDDRIAQISAFLGAATVGQLPPMNR
jgi:RNA polymerase sigma-70 factor (ECF subfamily)